MDTPISGDVLRPSSEIGAWNREYSLSQEAERAYATNKQLPNSFYKIGETIGNGIVVSSAIDIKGGVVPLVLVSNNLNQEVVLGDGDIRDFETIKALLNADQSLIVNYIVSDCGAEILKPLPENVGRQMIILPSQLNGAEHPGKGDGSIPIYELDKSSNLGLREWAWPRWIRTYMGDGTGGPVAQLRASLEVAQEVVRISEANSEKRTKDNWDPPLPINYVRDLINISGDGVTLQNG